MVVGAMSGRRRGRYGVDAPYALVGIGAGALGGALVGLATAVWAGLGWAAIPFGYAVLMLASCALYVHATRRGKFTVWSGLLDELGLRGDEQVLDLGCGRGAVLLAVARRLTAGRAVGVDLWRGADQSGNAMEVARGNAVAEGVDDRVELRTADMTDLPFPDGQFDVVVSSLAVHNIKSDDGRNKAVDEALRVLRPGGRLMIADISATAAYRRRLAQRGAVEARVRPLGWRMWWGGPWMSTSVVTAGKPLDHPPRP